jgi:hypothetical protein
LFIAKKENNSIDRKPFEASSAIAIFIAALLHILMCFAFAKFNRPVDFEICIKLITGAKFEGNEIATISSSLPYTSIYFVLLYLLSFIFGKLIQWFVFRTNPYKSSPLAFDTPWYYELKGKISENRDAEFIKISCLEENKDGAFLYYGILEDFYLTKDGDLDRLSISEVSRRRLSDDDNLEKTDTDRFYQIKGDRLILKYSQLKNINIEYLYVSMIK